MIEACCILFSAQVELYLEFNELPANSWPQEATEFPKIALDSNNVFLTGTGRTGLNLCAVSE